MSEPIYLSYFSQICRLLDLEGYLCSGVIGHPPKTIIDSFASDLEFFNELHKKSFGVPSKLSLTWIAINIPVGENYDTGEEEYEFKTIVYDCGRFDEKKILIKLGLDNLDSE